MVQFEGCEFLGHAAESEAAGSHFAVVVIYDVARVHGGLVSWLARQTLNPMTQLSLAGGSTFLNLLIPLGRVL